MKYKISAIICAASLILTSVSVAIGADSFTDRDTLNSEPETEISSVSDTDTTQDETVESETSLLEATTVGDTSPKESGEGESTSAESTPSDKDSPETTPEEESEPEESVQSIVYKYLTDELGLCSAAAAGIMGNVMIECGFDPSLEVIDTNDKPSFGIMMWNGPRYEALKKWCEENGFDKNDPRGQMGYLKWELENTEKGSYASMKNIPDTAEGAVLAAILWADEFERCTKTSYGLRVYYALNNYWQDYAGGSLGESEGVYGYYYNVPDNLKVGEPLTLYGAVVSYTSPLKSITAGVYTEDGKLVTGRTMSATNHVGNIGVVDRFIVMNKLPKGKYYYTITAKNETDEYVVERHLFTVTDEQTKTTLVYETEGGGLCEMGASCPSFRFNDMTPITHWAHGDIDFVLDNGFFLGNGAGYFLPQTNMSRSMFVTVLHRLSDKYGLIPGAPLTEKDETASEGESTPDGEQAETTPSGTEGTGEGTPQSGEATQAETSPSDMTPNDTVPSEIPPVETTPSEPEQMPFDDVIYDSWYVPHVLWAHEHDLVRGKGNGRFDPDGEISRGELAVLMYRAYERSGFDVSARADFSAFADGDSVPDWATEEMSWAVAVGLINGTVKGSVAELSTMDLATREQVSAIIRRFAALVETSEMPDVTPDVTPQTPQTPSVETTPSPTTPSDPSDTSPAEVTTAEAVTYGEGTNENDT